MKEQSGNAIENKGALWKKWWQSGNVVENKYSYTQKAGMLLNIRHLAKQCRSGAGHGAALKLRP
jgi:hypothetical protein